VRLLTLTLIGAALGLGGVALAQPTLVVDPWGRASGDADSWFAAEPAPRDDKLPVEAVLKDPWASSSEAKAQPVVAPLKPFETRPKEAVVGAAITKPVLVDPWAPVIASEIPSLRDPNAPATTDRSKLVPWSDRVVEIIDPWQRLPELASTDRIRVVVDPWAR
jgi:hypothetical protein